MVWPFTREDYSSPKNFEKALATLSDKIQRLQARDDTLRSLHRRLKVLLTLYGSFIYILVFLILTLVTGYEKWRTIEWSAVAGSPLVIIAARYILDLYFDWREGNVRFRLERATRERDGVIKKLKDAMRYDSTKELLDKYGGVEKKDNKNVASKKTPKSQQQQVQRTGVAPPPTANIPSRQPQPVIPIPSNPLEPSESFAPNAYDSPPPRTSVPAPNYPREIGSQPRPGFLDRMLDLIVGEDESAARNRIVLLCTSCRTVNGQAPPGVRSLEQLGRWRCVNCGAWNGVENEATEILKAVQAKEIPEQDMSEIKADIVRSST